MKPINLRHVADVDVQAAVEFYRREQDVRLALRFVAALETTFAAIQEHSAAGSSRYSYELEIGGLRTRHIRQFPYGVFYVERSETIEVWRVLHLQRDIPGSLAELD